MYVTAVMSSDSVVNGAQRWSLLAFNLQWSVTSLVTTFKKNTHQCSCSPEIQHYWLAEGCIDTLMCVLSGTEHSRLCELWIETVWRSAIASVLSDWQPRLQRRLARPLRPSFPPDHNSTLENRNTYRRVRNHQNTQCLHPSVLLHLRGSPCTGAQG